MSGYTEEEKLGIAKGYLLPREMEKHGLKNDQVEFKEEALLTIIREFTREAGVRNLEREIGTVLRKIATKIVKDKKLQKFVVTKGSLQEYLGAIRYHFGLAEEGRPGGDGDRAGLDRSRRGHYADRSHDHDRARGLDPDRPAGGRHAGIGQGGDELCPFPGQEPWPQTRISTANSTFISTFRKERSPKTGRRLGSPLPPALVSALTGLPVRKDVAMTGEVTLRGESPSHRRVERKTAWRLDAPG